mmetsp:Transcript_32586/g.96045  ORF Transcript_32586/g.96045 Transcript_32586/m.96045 type:complete len:85 (+) Transcript_32586:44-298(+)
MLAQILVGMGLASARTQKVPLVMMPVKVEILLVSRQSAPLVVTHARVTRPVTMYLATSVTLNAEAHALAVRKNVIVIIESAVLI